MVKRYAETPTHDVAIVGYGPVGALLANLLGKAGLSVLVLERDVGPYPLPRATHFDDEVMRVFQSVGLAETIAPLTLRTCGMRFLAPDGTALLHWPRPAERGPQGWFFSYRFHQPDLDRVLRRGAERWPGVSVRQGCEVVAITQDDDVVTLHHEDRQSSAPGQAQARYVVGCDGARSVVRRLIGGDLLDLGFHERWLVVDCVLKRDRPDLGDWSLQYCDPVRPATYVRGTGRRRRWEVATLPEDRADDLIRPEEVWRLLSRWVTPDDAELERATVYTFHSALASRWRAGRLLIAGDAAHQSPPFLGQGLCAGLRDCANLAWKLHAALDGRAPPSVLDSYGSERAPHVREYIELAVRLGGLINATDPQAALAGMARGGDGTARMASLKPRLGPGLCFGADPLIGTQAPQPVLADGRRFDDVVGDGFMLVLGPTGERPQRWSWTGVSVVPGGDPTFDAWLSQSGVAAALVRPDRYVMAVARTEAEIEAMWHLLPGAPGTVTAGAGRHPPPGPPR